MVAATLHRRPHLAAPAAALAAAALVAGALLPGRLGPVYRAWMGLALAISRVTTPIVMGAIYFGVCTPLGVVMRLLGHRLAARPANAATFWVERPPGARRGDMRRQF